MDQLIRPWVIHSKSQNWYVASWKSGRATTQPAWLPAMAMELSCLCYQFSGVICNLSCSFDSSSSRHWPPTFAMVLVTLDPFGTSKRWIRFISYYMFVPKRGGTRAGLLLDELWKNSCLCVNLWALSGKYSWLIGTLSTQTSSSSVHHGKSGR